MRPSTLLKLSVGAAAGAGATYLLDPDHGPERRRELRRNAMARARHRAVDTARGGQVLAREVLAAAVAGYRGTPPDATDGAQPRR